MDINAFCNNLEENSGIFFSKKRSAISYPETGNDVCLELEDESFWFRHRNDCIVEAVKKYQPGTPFFDIGGGNGFVAKGLEDAAIETVLVEPGISGARNAKNRNLKNIICATFEDAAFRDGSIPAVGLFDVVEHIDDDMGFLQSVFNCITDGGMIFITVPSYQLLWSSEDVDGGHFRRYTRSGMERILKQTGFDIIYSSYIFSILPVPIFLGRTIPSKLGWKSKSSDVQTHKNAHKAKEGMVSVILNKIWQKEVRNIMKGTEMKFGGSCFMVAQKNRKV